MIGGLTVAYAGLTPAQEIFGDSAEKQAERARKAVEDYLKSTERSVKRSSDRPIHCVNSPISNSPAETSQRLRSVRANNSKRN